MDLCPLTASLPVILIQWETGMERLHLWRNGLELLETYPGDKQPHVKVLELQEFPVGQVALDYTCNQLVLSIDILFVMPLMEAIVKK